MMTDMSDLPTSGNLPHLLDYVEEWALRAAAESADHDQAVLPMAILVHDATPTPQGRISLLSLGECESLAEAILTLRIALDVHPEHRAAVLVVEATHALVGKRPELAQALLRPDFDPESLPPDVTTHTMVSLYAQSAEGPSLARHFRDEGRFKRPRWTLWEPQPSAEGNRLMTSDPVFPLFSPNRLGHPTQ